MPEISPVKARLERHPFSKIDIADEKALVFERKVVLSDLDIVNHVNNVKYLEWCLDLLDETSLLEQKISALEMNFLKELSLKDQVAIHELQQEDKTTFSITKEGKSVFALELHFK